MSIATLDGSVVVKSFNPDKTVSNGTEKFRIVPETADDRVAYNKRVIDDIVGMIRAKYEDEGQRNFRIGKRAFEHAQWQKGNFPGRYEAGDFTKLMDSIRDEVRFHVPIKATSIRVADWTRCHVLRELVRREAGDDVAECMTMFEYLAIVGKALHFKTSDLEGDLNPYWLDMVKSVYYDRSNPGGRVTREDFENRVVATEKEARDAKLAQLSPAEHQAKVATEAIRKHTAAVAKSEKAITDSVNDAIASGVVSPEKALNILEKVAATHGKPLVAASIGFDPTACTVADCETLASAMFAAGKLTEMEALVSALTDRIGKMGTPSKSVTKGKGKA